MMSSGSNQACPVCGAACSGRFQRDSTTVVDCPSCGSFQLTLHARDEAGTLTAEQRGYISCALAKESRAAGRVPLLSSGWVIELARHAPREGSKADE